MKPFPALFGARRCLRFCRAGFLPLLAFLAFTEIATTAEGDEKGAFPLEGTWRWSFTMPDGTVVRPKLKLTTEKGAIAGTTSFRPGTETPVTNALISGDHFSFQVVRQREGQETVTTYSGRWSSNAIKGRIESNWAGDNQNYAWDAQRINIGVEGIWRWTNSFFRGFGGGAGRGAGGDSSAASEGAQTNRTDRTNRADRAPAGERAPGGRGPGDSGGGRGPGGGRGGRGFESRVELEQDGTKLLGKTIQRFGRPSALTNGFFTNGVVYFEIERVFFENRSLTKYQGKQTGDTIKGTMESEVDGEEKTIDWEATRVD